MLSGSTCAKAAHRTLVKLTQGVNFINVPSTAFAPIDPNSVKRYCQFDWILMLLGDTCIKAVCKNVDEIDGRSLPLTCAPKKVDGCRDRQMCQSVFEKIFLFIMLAEKESKSPMTDQHSITDFQCSNFVSEPTTPRMKDYVTWTCWTSFALTQKKILKKYLETFIRRIVMKENRNEGRLDCFLGTYEDNFSSLLSPNLQSEEEEAIKRF